MELRQKYALNGIVLYLTSTVFVCYLSFNVRTNELQPVVWNALFWIIILFTAINAAAKSFIQEKDGRFLYYYILHSPQALIISRIIYNALLMLVLSLAGLFFYSLVLGNPIADVGLFSLCTVLAAIGFSATLTLISAIASKAGNNQTLMATLSFPIILPMLLMVIKLSKNAIDGLDRASSMDELLTLIAINVIVLVLSFILFPYLWRS